MCRRSAVVSVSSRCRGQHGCAEVGHRLAGCGGGGVEVGECRCRVVPACRFGGGHPTRCTGRSWPARRVGDRWRARRGCLGGGGRGRRRRHRDRVVVHGRGQPGLSSPWSKVCSSSPWSRSASKGRRRRRAWGWAPALGGPWRSGRAGRGRCATWPGRSPIGRRRERACCRSGTGPAISTPAAMAVRATHRRVAEPRRPVSTVGCSRRDHRGDGGLLSPRSSAVAGATTGRAAHATPPVGGRRPV